MQNDIKPRSIRILRELPISQVTDEEIVKAALDRLQSKSVMLGYIDDGRWIFQWYYKIGFYPYVKPLIEYIKGWFNCKSVNTGESE